MCFPKETSLCYHLLSVVVCIYTYICTRLHFNQSYDNYVLKEAFLNGQAAMKKNAFIHLCNLASAHENQRLYSCMRMWDAFPLVHVPWLTYSKRSNSSGGNFASQFYWASPPNSHTAEVSSLHPHLIWRRAWELLLHPQLFSVNLKNTISLNVSLKIDHPFPVA